MKHLEIKWAEIHLIIKTKLKLAGFDLDKEIIQWPKFEEDNVTMVYEQGEDAKMLQNTSRPSYLDRWKEKEKE